MLQEPLDNLGEDMTPEEMSKSVAANKAEIDKLSRIVSDIQEECRHENYDVKNIGTTPVLIKKVCRVCDADLGYPSKDELKEAGY
jgi:hypothetical protein